MEEQKNIPSQYASIFPENWPIWKQVVGASIILGTVVSVIYGVDRLSGYLFPKPPKTELDMRVDEFFNRYDSSRNNVITRNEVKKIFEKEDSEKLKSLDELKK